MQFSIGALHQSAYQDNLAQAYSSFESVWRELVLPEYIEDMERAVQLKQLMKYQKTFLMVQDTKDLHGYGLKKFKDAYEPDRFMHTYDRATNNSALTTIKTYRIKYNI